MKISELMNEATGDKKFDQMMGKIKADAKSLRQPKKELTMTQAFGSDELAALEEAGIHLTEKPDYWEDFEGDGFAAKRNITKALLASIEKIVGKLKVYEGDEIFGIDNDGNDKPKGPLADARLPREKMFIVKFMDGTKYLCDTTGAKSYIRNWQKMV